TAVTLPDVDTIPDSSDRFYRGHFTLSALSDLSFSIECDDGCDVYINGQELVSFGACHIAGCVNLPAQCAINQESPPVSIPAEDLLVGGNVLAVHVSNGPGGSYFDLSVSQGASTATPSPTPTPAPTPTPTPTPTPPLTPTPTPTP